MIARLEPDEIQLESPLGCLGPLTKLGIAVAWLIGLTTTTSVWTPTALTVAILLVATVLGRVRPSTFIRAALPLWVAALSVGFFNAVLAAANADPGAAEIARFGPLRLTEPGLAGGIGLGARIVAIAAIGVAFAQTTDSTRLVDALVQQARLPDRFAYGALAAYQALPRLSEDLSTLRQARRIRGLRTSWHPRLLIALLVLAIRHGDRLALAMDARGFGSGPRSRYREVRWTWHDPVAAAAALGLLVGALALAR